MRNSKLINKIFNVIIFLSCIMGAAVLSINSSGEFSVLEQVSKVLLGISAVWILLSNAVFKI